MFAQLSQKTIELLEEKASNYPFEEIDENLNNDNSEKKKNQNNINFASEEFLNSLKSVGQFELDIGLNNDLLQNESWDEYLIQLQRCSLKLKKLKEKREKCEQILKELGEKYNSVTDKTSSLHDACDRMMSEQTQLATANESISASLHYYQQYDWLLKKLATPKLSLTGTLFTQILSTIHECISYLRAHPEQNEAEQYIHKYEQCLSRSLTAIKAGVLADLESCRQDVLYRQSRFAAPSQDGSGRPGILSCMDNDDTFALLYGIFGVKANAIRNAFQQAFQFFATYPEYQTIVSECEQEYFSIRNQLLRPIVQATLQALCLRHQNSSCTLTRDGCTFLLRLCDDELRLYKQFFVLDLDQGTKTAMTPSSPSLFSFWPLYSNEQHSSAQHFHSFIENISRIFYDTLRPLIIHNQHLETLAQLCTLLKVEMIDERCGLRQTPDSAAVDFTSLQQQQTSISRIGFIRVINELVADIVERIVYRTSLFAKSDILDYNPASGDLVYPERLLMMQKINDGDTGKTEKEQNKNLDDQINVEDCETIGPLPPAKKSGTGYVKLTKQASTSPIDQHCLWYPTVKRTVMCLSKLYRCLDPTVFMNVSRELLDSCCQSLEHAVERIRALPIDSARSTIKNSPNRTIDSELFIIKHLLILREQTSPYRQHQKQKQPPMQTLTRSNSVLSSGSGIGIGQIEETQIHPQLDYQLDLSKYTQSMLQLLNPENRARWFEFGTNNALLSLLLLTPVHVSELQTDSRRIIEQHLKRWCHIMIVHISDLLLGPLANFQSELDQFQNEQEQRAKNELAPLDVASSERYNPRALNDRCSQAFKQLKQNWPQVRAAFGLYIGMRETEEILLQPIRRAVCNAFSSLSSFAERHYEEEQRLIICAPGQEQIWLILNA
uniref:Conserved oligomeric Golgi complex subunit 3 n=2 Tax=Meloidogyne incognita group TaxID=654580 RepID=A0A914MSI0_MELIC